MLKKASLNLQNVCLPLLAMKVIRNTVKPLNNWNVLALKQYIVHLF